MRRECTREMGRGEDEKGDVEYEAEAVHDSAMVEVEVELRPGDRPLVGERPCNSSLTYGNNYTNVHRLRGASENDPRFRSQSAGQRAGA